MGDGFYFIDILIFAMIAAFLVYRLHNVLGRRDTDERQRPNPFAAPPLAPQDNVIPLPNQPAASAAPAPPPLSAAAGLAQIKALDSAFDADSFLAGAGKAFTMIVTAYAAGDTAALRPLLNDKVFEQFAAAIKEHTAAGETLDTKIERVSDLTITEASTEGRMARITVRIKSDQTHAVHGTDGAAAVADADQIIEVTDLWTFARNTRARDPNWTLVETHTVG